MRTDETAAAGPMVVHMIGNAHLDPVWLWPWQRGSDEAVATCRAACELLEAYPEATFTRGEAWVYEQVRARDEALFHRIRGHVESGRWEVVGGWYVQADTNLPTDRALLRNIQLGHDWFGRHLGLHDFPVAYLVDSFGHGPYLPTILRRAGQGGFVFMRPGPTEMALPGSLFRWRSPDGEEVLAARLAQYLAKGPDLASGLRDARAQASPATGHALCCYGVGDHGGGPTRATVEWILEHREFAPGVRLEFSSVHRYFEAVASHSDDCPTVEAELRPHAVGCYSVCGALKRELRAAEQGAADLDEVLHTRGAEPRTEPELEAAWEAICFNQFHDVVTGSALREAIDVARRQVGEAQNRIDRVVHRLTRGHPAVAASSVIGHRLHVANLSTRPWAGLAECEVWFDWREWDHHLEDASGRAVPMQRLSPASLIREPAAGIAPIPRLLFPVTLGPDAVESFRIAPGPAAQGEGGPRFAAGVLANGLVCARFGEYGLAQVRALTGSGADVLGGPLAIQVRADRTDTWAHGVDRFAGEVLEVACFGPPELVETGPLRTTVRMGGRLSRRVMALEASLEHDEAVLYLTLTMNYAEPLSLLQVAVPLRSPVAEMEHRASGGWIRRPSDGQEYPLHHALRVEGEVPLGLVLPDSFAVSADPEVVRPTLLRNSVNAAHASGGLGPDLAADLRGRFGTDEGPQVIRLALAIGEAARRPSLEARLHRYHHPVQTWDDYRGVPRVG